MITEKKFCKGCGQKIDINPLSNIISKTYVELDNGFYCMECAKKRIAKRRAELK